LAYAYRAPGAVVPLARFIALAENLDLLAGSIIFNRTRARELVTELISRQGCANGGCTPTDWSLQRRVSLASGATPGSPSSASSAFTLQPAQDDARSTPHLADDPVADEFFRRILAEDISQSDVFRITTTSFMDAYNFDVRQEMKSCVHFVLPSGHIIPFSAYNLLYRPGLVPLPPLQKQFTTRETRVIEQPARLQTANR
jgi:hypothetical protein